jgi:hypothetical protein
MGEMTDAYTIFVRKSKKDIEGIRVYVAVPLTPSASFVIKILL